MTIVYLIQSQQDPSRYYVGITENLEERLRRHNSDEKGSTKKLRPWKLVVAIQFIDRLKAEAFERYLKSGSGRAFAKRHF